MNTPTFSWRLGAKPGLARNLLRLATIGIGLASAGLATSSWAQSSACSATEDVVTFNFAATNTTNATGTSATWTAPINTDPIVNTIGVATPGTLRSNTITFNIGITGAVWQTGFPSLNEQGGVLNSLDLNMDSGAPGDEVTMLMSFNRPMSKVRFNMYDVDRSSGWQDVLRITGRLGGVAVPAPVLVPTTPSSYSISTVGGGSEIVTNLSSNCASTSGACNVEINFSAPVDSIQVLFTAGPQVASPTSQRVGFNRFSYCVPKVDLSMTKVDTVPTFVAGTTNTYALTVTNLGGGPTVGSYSVVDVLSAPGVSFTNPQSPGGGWTCSLSTTATPQDTANCQSSTVIASNASTVLTLTVSVSPDSTATSLINRAKVFGGGDGFKTTATTTGPVASCSSINEGLSGGGTNTNAGCAYELTDLARQGNLSVVKSNSVGTLSAGQTTTYVLTVNNTGPSSANNALVRDPVVTGLSCTSVGCTVASGTAVCPAPLTIANLQGGGVTVATLPANSSLNFQVNCTVTATGVP